MNIRSNPVNTDPEGVIKSVSVNGVSLKMRDPGNEVGCPYIAGYI